MKILSFQPTIVKDLKILLTCVLLFTQLIVSDMFTTQSKYNSWLNTIILTHCFYNFKIWNLIFIPGQNWQEKKWTEL